MKLQKFEAYLNEVVKRKVNVKTLAKSKDEAEYYVTVGSAVKLLVSVQENGNAFVLSFDKATVNGAEYTSLAEIVDTVDANGAIGLELTFDALSAAFNEFAINFASKTLEMPISAALKNSDAKKVTKKAVASMKIKGYKADINKDVIVLTPK